MFIIHNGLKLSHKFNGNMKYLKKSIFKDR